MFDSIKKWLFAITTIFTFTFNLFSESENFSTTITDMTTNLLHNIIELDCFCEHLEQVHYLLYTID